MKIIYATNILIFYSVYHLFFKFIIINRRYMFILKYAYIDAHLILIFIISLILIT
jgi:hypothetical protein